MIGVVISRVERYGRSSLLDRLVVPPNPAKVNSISTAQLAVGGIQFDGMLQHWLCLAPVIEIRGQHKRSNPLRRARVGLELQTAHGSGFRRGSRLFGIHQRVMFSVRG